MKTHLELTEIELMEQASTCIRDELLIEMMYRLGCRVSEVLALTVEDIDLARGLVTIIHLKSRLRLFCPECKARLSKVARYYAACGKMVDAATMREAEHHRLRTLPLNPHTLALLKNYINQGGPVCKYGKKFIFGINRHRAWQIVRDCADRAGIPALINPETGRVRGISPHRLRDAFAVRAMKMDDSGDGLRLLQEHLGHASFNTTAKYRKVAGEELKQWYDRLWRKESDRATS